MTSSPMMLPEISKELRKIMDANMDEAPARREAREAIKHIQLGLDHILFKIPCDGLKMKESYEVNSRGLEIFTKNWLPNTSSPKALVFFCHGYGESCTFFAEGIARKLASFGYGVFAMDYPGFGLSEGLHGYVPSFESIVDDVIEFCTKIKGNPEFCELPSFLLGQSMGGGVALKVHFKQPNAWTGAILQAPMSKIADHLIPPWFVVKILTGLSNLLPTRKLIPQSDMLDTYRDPKKREQDAAYNVIAYRGKPRLKTGLEMLRAAQEIERRLEEVSLPLLILQGEADCLTCPSGSKALYEKARSLDKTLKLYRDGWHGLLEGEPDEVIIQVFNDIISWLDEHGK